ncbi:MAG: DEAD/DEAH box helicase [Gemmatimonadota bacterium]|nr:DEAD/DEAH box helicase [Gemmatimonadota bacterium]MDE3004905.1 DEAD/DEAH box helicase [Gemmatimonadota bacterium]
MKSFEDLSVLPELTEALAAEGIETPTPLQEAALPVVGRGNNIVLAAGPGSGVFGAWVAGLLGRLEPSANTLQAVVLCATADAADRLAESAARLTAVTGHTVAALGSAWVLPDRADLLFSTPGGLLASMEAGSIDLSSVEVLVVDQAQLIENLTGLAEIERVLEYLPSGRQRILTSLPVTAGVQDLLDRHFKRTITIPTPETGVPKRGQVRFRIAPEPTEAAALSIVDELISDGARHVLVFCRSEDRAADVGDYLTLHGFVAGAPGDPSVPVWLGVDALEARAAAEGVEGLAVLSCDPPADPDTLDRRHSLTDNGVVVVLPRETAHIRALGKRTGYDTVPFPPPSKADDATAQIRAMLTRALEDEDTTAYLSVLEPIFREHDPAEVAAAAVALLRKKKNVSEHDSAGRATAASRATGTPAWSKLFVGVGERDGLTKGDLLGAITGEAGVGGEAVGRIDIKESHSVVEVHEQVARTVIQSLNGTSIHGRAARVDFDRPRGKAPPRKGRSPR